MQVVIQATWADPEVTHTIHDILIEYDLFQIENVFDQAGVYIEAFIDSVTVEFLDYKVTGRIETPHFNVLAESPTASAHAWMVLQQFLTSITYPTPLYGTGITANLFLCTLCHLVSHPRGLCDFPNVPHWNSPLTKSKQKGGPKYKNNVAKEKHL